MGPGLYGREELVVLCVLFTIRLFAIIAKAVIYGESLAKIGFIPALAFSGDLSPWVSSLFYHGSIDHLISNGIALILFGYMVERDVGWPHLVGLFFAGGFGGHIAAIFFEPFPLKSSVGASAAIMAMMVYFLRVSWSFTNGQHRPQGVSDKILAFWPMVIFFILVILPDLMLAAYQAKGFVVSRIGHIEHVGGAVVGWIYYEFHSPKVFKYFLARGATAVRSNVRRVA